MTEPLVHPTSGLTLGPIHADRGAGWLDLSVGPLCFMLDRNRDYYELYVAVDGHRDGMKAQIGSAVFRWERT